ncbi:molybdenum cofactor biosysynthesis protein [Pseudomonas sp. WN033]|nr:molybdenum cofactor biosysynthesis protein [Pseudomonas sp. WN033]
MTQDINLVAISRAQPEWLDIGKRRARTGHFKRPVTTPLPVGPDGLAGDFIADGKHHGGPDQALYLYSQADIDWWSGQLERELMPGFFGENLTLSDWWELPRIGDRLRIGEVLLELTGPRIPCSTLAARAGEPTFAKTFARAARSGAYVRVLEPGVLEAGMPCQLEMRGAAEWPGIEETFRYWLGKTRSETFVRRALASPIALRMRRELDEWLVELEAGTAPLPGI